jgi:cellulose synthase/poly-beta-1,6-N-acetylglucosamine synthase-like glycosyltransferase
MAPVDVVIVTRDRRDRLLATLSELGASGAARVIVVDNASSDGSAGAVVARYPEVVVVPLPANVGAAARNVGVALSTAPYVAFSDDDSWWLPGALDRAAQLFDRHPRLGLLAAQVLVGPDATVDPVCAAMASSPLGWRGGPGPDVLGFLACGAVVRRDPFLDAGGFSIRFGIGGEEELLAIDLRQRGWQVVYCDEVVCRHFPVPARPGPRGGPWRDPAPRQRRQARNALWTAWLRRPLSDCLRPPAAARPTPERPGAAAWRQGRRDAAAEWRWVLTHRRPATGALVADLRRLDNA